MSTISFPPFPFLSPPHTTLPPPTTTTSTVTTTSLALNPSLAVTTTSSSSVSPSVSSALHHCSIALCPRATSELHAHLLRHGLTADSYLSSQLLRFYASCGQLGTARSFLRATPTHLLTPFFYNVLIRAHTDSFLYEDTVHLFLEMLRVGLGANEFTFPFVLKSCSALGLLGVSQQVHAVLVKSGILLSNVFSATALLDVYAKWGCLGDACKMFDRIPDRNIVAWNSVISSYVQNGFFKEALGMLELMASEFDDDVGQSSWNSVIAGCVRRGDSDSALEMLGKMVESVKPNPATFNTLLPVIPDIDSVSILKELHAYTVRHGHLIRMESIDDERLRSAIASGYALNGYLDYALTMFNIISLRNCQLWNSMISGFIGIGKSNEAFGLFRDMAIRYSQELRTLSKVSMTLVLSECDPSSKSGLEIHGYAYRHGLASYASMSNALIAMYTRRGDIVKSEHVFSSATEKDTVTWNTMVSSYTLVLDFDEAFRMFHQMLSEGAKPDEFSFGSLLNGCGHTSSLLLGMALHCHIIKGGFAQSNCVVQNALVDMYGKCGCIEDSRRIFDAMEFKDTVSWNSIITCYAFNACPDEAFLLFDKMKEEGCKPNRVTFIGLLSASSHAGLLDKGLRYFESMSKDHGIVPDVDHYTCIVDGLSRAGQLDHAYQLIQSMHVRPDDCVWGSLLAGCRIHGNVALAELAAKHLIELEPKHSGYRVLLSNVYADALRWRNVARVRSAMKADGVMKNPGYSWLELCGSVHKFFTADKSHRQWRDILPVLAGLTKQLRDEGYTAQSIPLLSEGERTEISED